MVLFEQGPNDRIQKLAVLRTQLGQQVRAPCSGHAPVEVAGDHAHAVHYVRQRRSLHVLLQPCTQRIHGELCICRCSCEHERIEGSQHACVAVA